MDRLEKGRKDVGKLVQVMRRAVEVGGQKYRIGDDFLSIGGRRDT